MKKDKPKFLNFPISLLQGFMEATKGTLGNILDYCIIYEMEVHQRPFDEARKMFNMAEPYDIMNFVEDARVVFNSTSRNQPRTGLEVGMFWEFYLDESPFGKKTDEEKATLLAFLAIKSIVGIREWCKLGKQEIIFHRMAGFPDCKSELPESIKPFCTRYKFDKIKKALMQHWGISIYSSHTRGLYIGTIPLQELALIAERRKQQSKQKETSLKAQQEAVRNRALQMLGIEDKQKHL